MGEEVGPEVVGEEEAGEEEAGEEEAGEAEVVGAADSVTQRLEPWGHGCGQHTEFSCWQSPDVPYQQFAHVAAAHVTRTSHSSTRMVIRESVPN